MRPVIARNLGASDTARRGRASSASSVCSISGNINVNENDVFSRDSHNVGVANGFSERHRLVITSRVGNLSDGLLQTVFPTR